MIEKFNLTRTATLKGTAVFGLAILACLILIVLVYFCIKKCAPKCHRAIQRLCQRLKNMLMFNSILRYFMMIYLGLTTGSCLVIHNAIVDPRSSDTLSLALAIMILAVFALMIWPLTRVVIKNKARLLDPDFRQRFGTLYIPCETHRGVIPLLFIAIFCTRRLLVAIVSVFFVNYPLLQILITLLLCTGVLIWHLISWPMENSRQNFLYFTNEYLYSVCICCSPGFSEYNYDPETRFIVGWFYLAFLGAILLLNITVMLIDIIAAAIAYCKNR